MPRGTLTVLGVCTALGGLQDVEGGLHVGHNGTHVERNAPLGDDAASDLIDDHLLVARRIKSAHGVNPELGVIGKLPLEGLHRPMIVLLQGHHTLLRAHLGHNQVQGLEQPPGLLGHELLVHPQQGLTLRAVDDDRVRLGVELHMGGKARAARADNAGAFHESGQIFFHKTHLSLFSGRPDLRPARTCAAGRRTWPRSAPLRWDRRW